MFEEPPSQEQQLMDLRGEAKRLYPPLH